MGAVASTAGSLVGANAGKNAQKAANAAAGSAAQNQTQVTGAETGALDQLLAGYFGGNAPGTNTPANPYNAGQTSAMGTANKLENFQGLQPGQLSALQNTLGQNNESMVNSLRASGGGVANQNNMYSDLSRQGNQAATNAGVQLGGQAAQNQLAGLQSAGQLQSTTGGQQQQGLFTALSALSGLGNMYSNQGGAAAAASQKIGSPYGNALTQIGGKGGSSPGSGGGGGGGLLSGGAEMAPGALQTLGGGAASDPLLLAAASNQRHMGGGAPSAQGFNGGLGGAQNPNTGGFNGLTGSEMTQPGMGYQQTQGGLGSLGPAKRGF